MSLSEEILTAIAAERQRQFDLPGTESDVQKGPNDWITTIITLLIGAQTRHGIPPTAEEFRDAMIKASAVSVAAIEHVDLMSSKNRIR
jgi:hypothetical protein